MCVEIRGKCWESFGGLFTFCLFFVFKTSLFILCKWVLPACLSVYRMHSESWKARRGSQVSRDWKYRELYSPNRYWENLSPLWEQHSSTQALKSPWSSPTYFMRQGLSLNLDLINSSRLAGYPGTFLSLPHPTVELLKHILVPAFLCDCPDSKLRSSSLAEENFLTAISLAPIIIFHIFTRWIRKFKWVERADGNWLSTNAQTLPQRNFFIPWMMAKHRNSQST